MMLHRRLTLLVVAASLAAGATPLLAAGNVSPEERRARLQAIKQRFDRMPELQRNALSGAARNLRAGVNRALNQAPRARDARGSFGGREVGGRRGAGIDSGSGSIEPNTLTGYPVTILTAGKVSDPKYDVVLSRYGGFSQSTTSTAWCAPNVVVAFNDSGSYLESAYFGVGIYGYSYVGYSRATDNGTTFRDQNFLDSNDDELFLTGDPVVRCTSSNNFIISGGMTDYTNGNSAIVVSRSSNGGLDFGSPVTVAEADYVDHFLDKPWMAVDPSDPNGNTVYVTYTEFDSSAASGVVCDSTSSVISTTSGGSSTVFTPIPRTMMKISKSTDGGQTWAAPIQLNPGPSPTDGGVGECYPDVSQGSYVEVARDGKVYVSWLHTPFGSPTKNIQFVRSTNGGTSFSSPIVADIAYPLGGDIGNGQFVMQGNILANQYPHIAVDRSTGLARSGHVYITHADGRYVSRPDIASLSGLYNYGDVFLTRSTDFGTTWSQTSARVNSNPEPPATDQYFPGIAVDSKGGVKVCFYDGRRDVGNFLYDRECASSTTTGGATWTNAKVSLTNAPALPNQDHVWIDNLEGIFGTSAARDALYHGGYDDLTVDFRLFNSSVLPQVGFRGGYSENALGNPDVKLNK